MKTKFHYFLSIPFLICTSFTLQAQSDCKECGQYYCESISEMASGFYIKSDSTFEFFFSYGALDRSGFGTWRKTSTADGNELLILNSNPTKDHPLSLVKKRCRKEDQTTLQLIEINPTLSIYFIAMGFIEQDTVYSYFNQQGEVVLDGVAFDSLQVALEFCPDHILRIPSAKKHNYFELKCDQTIFEIFFRNFSLLITTDKLEGKHPVLDGKYQYLKSN
jgi:hypothetical protein